MQIIIIIIQSVCIYIYGRVCFSESSEDSSDGLVLGLLEVSATHDVCTEHPAAGKLHALTLRANN